MKTALALAQELPCRCAVRTLLIAPTMVAEGLRLNVWCGDSYRTKKQRLGNTICYPTAA